jgi:hypothetical protein
MQVAKDILAHRMSPAPKDAGRFSTRTTVGPPHFARGCSQENLLASVRRALDACEERGPPHTHS